MKRPAGVVVSAIVLILGSLVQLMLAAAMVFAGMMAHRQLGSGASATTPAGPPLAPWMPASLYGFAAFLILLSLWGILTAVGVLRLRRWARYSILVIGGGLALFGLISTMGTLFLLLFPMPAPPTVDPAHAASAQFAMKAVFATITFLYATETAIGVWWLVYFNRKTMRDLFAGGQVEAAAGARPFLIALFAALSMIGAVGCLLMLFLPFPGALFGALLQGWEKTALYLACAIAEAAIAVGLWRLREWGSRLALGFLCFGFAQSLFNLLHPSFLLHYSEEMSRRLAPMRAQTPMPHQNAFFAFSSIVGMVIVATVCVVLIRYRAAFQRAPEASA